MNLILKKWGERILHNRQYAAGIALVAAFFSFFSLPLIGWISTLIIALVTLQNSPKVGLIVAAWAMLPAVALLYLGHYGIFINVVILHYAIVWLLAVGLRRTNWINLLQFGTLVGIAAVIGIYYLAPGLQDLLTQELSSFAKGYKASLFSFKSADTEVWLKYITQFATGLLAIGVLISNLMTLYIARSWQSLVAPIVSVKKEWHGIRLHYSTSLLLVALSPGLFFNPELFINLLIVAVLPFVFSGLSLLHAYTATKRNCSVLLFAFYLLFIFFSPYLIILISLMGWLDSFINFRKRIVTLQHVS